MGGKTKQSQRTKNNVRPSSSSRSAEHLSGGFSIDGGLMSFAAGKPLPPLFPTLATAHLEQVLNPEYQMCIKKLNKKDPITRAKALNELSELVNNGDVEDVVAILPSWAHFYKILTADTDRKVREVTQMCHGAIVRVCGRRMAPQLKALLPAWLDAQYDDHAPAQSHAQRSLTWLVVHCQQSTFPDSKLPEVISFCKAEVMSHLLDNLNGNTEAIITKRIASAEDRALVLCRVWASSLQGLRYFCAQLPPAQHAWLWERLQALLQGKHYWKHAHAAPIVRAAWYGATASVMERFGASFGAEYGARALRVLLAAAERGASAQLWQCLLVLMHRLPDWHTYLDKKELLVKRILDVLENGGWGDAKNMSNMLLPLLAYLPQDIVTKDFYEAFFNAVFAGLEKKNVLNSKSERQAWISSLSECVRYVSIQAHAFVPELLGGVTRAWLAVLCTHRDTATTANLVRCSATNMAALLKYWLKLSKEQNGEKYDQLVRNFWQNVGSTVLTQIDKTGTDHNEVEKLIEAHIILLQTLKTSFSQEVKKQHSIKFDGDVPTVAEASPVVSPACDDATVERYRHNLHDVVHKICAHYLNSADKKQISSIILTPLITLLVEFDSEQLFTGLARQFEVDSVYKLYDKVLRGWLVGDTMRCKTVVDIVFLLMKYMSEEEQDAMFVSFQQFPPVVVEWCLSVCVRHPHVRARSVRRWLRGHVVRAALRALCARAPDHAPSAALLCACLTDEPTGELLVSEASVSDVVSGASAAISSADVPSLEQRAGLAARLATALHEHAACDSLLLQLFRLNMRVPRGDSRLSLDTWCEVRSSWQDGAAALSRHQRPAFLQRAANLLLEELLLPTEDLDITRIENILSLCPRLINLSDYDEAPEDVTEIITFTKQVLNALDIESTRAAVETCALRLECVTSRLNCLYEDDHDYISSVVANAANHKTKELTKEDLLPYVNKQLFRAICLRNVLLNSHEGDDEPRVQQTWCNAILKDEYIQTEFYNVLHTFVVINSLHEGYAFWAHYDMLTQTKQKLESALTSILGASSPELRSELGSALSARSLCRGYFWAYARRWYARHTAADPEHVDDQLMEGQKLEDIISGNGFFHTLQASTKWGSAATLEYSNKYLVLLRSWYIAYGDCGDDVVRDVVRCRERCDIDVVVNAYYKHNHTMLYDKDISACPWSAVMANVSVLEFLTEMVSARGWDAPAHHWDFTTISLCSLLTSVRKSMDIWGSVKLCSLARAALRLWRAVRCFVCGVRAESERRQPAAHVAALPREWADIFQPDTAHNLFSIVRAVLDSHDDTEMMSTHIEVLEELIECTRLLDWDVLAEPLRRGELSLQRLVSSACGALGGAVHHALARLAHTLLQTLAKPLVLDDALKLKQWSDEGQEGDEERQRPQYWLDHFHDTFTRLHELVDAALSAVVLGEGTCALVAQSDSYNVALGWLLLGDVLCALCRLARQDLVHHYIQLYSSLGYAEWVLSACLRLLPLDVLALAPEQPRAPPQCAELFLRLRDYSVHEPAASADISALSCRALYCCVTGAGAGGARAWSSAAPARAQRLLQRVVCAYVAPPAASEQLRALQQHDIEDAEIRISWTSSEVTCIYNVEERPIELTVTLSRAHPLVPPTLSTADEQGPGSNTQWVALYLAYQNGSILNALKMWTRAVSAKVESSPQCYICYCRLHPTDGRLPRVLCYQCKNKFHNTCLRKWFTTSNKSKCPLCRSAF